MPRTQETSQNFFSDPASPPALFPARKHTPKQLRRKKYINDDEVGIEMQREMAKRTDIRRATARKLIKIAELAVVKALYNEASQIVKTINDILEME